MLDAALSFLLMACFAAISFAYKLGYSHGRELLPEKRDGMITSLIAGGFFLGSSLSAFVASATQMQPGFWRDLLLLGGAIAGCALIGAAGNRLFHDTLRGRPSRVH